MGTAAPEAPLLQERELQGNEKRESGKSEDNVINPEKVKFLRNPNPRKYSASPERDDPPEAGISANDAEEKEKEKEVADMDVPAIPRDPRYFMHDDNRKA